MKTLTRFKWPFSAAAIVSFGALLPVLFTGDLMMTVIINALIFTIVVYSLSIILGMGGHVTFSTAGMMGIGAYTSGILTARLGVHPLPAMLASIIVVVIFSFLLGVALFRLKGTYFSFATIAFAQIAFVIMINWRPVTGGAEGLRNIPHFHLGFMAVDTLHRYLYTIYIFVVLCGLAVARIRKSSLGRSLAAIRDNEIAAQCLGVNLYRTKIIAFMVSGVFSAISGSLYAHFYRYLSPVAFQFDQAALFLVMGMLGGISSTVGAFIGAAALTVLPEYMRFLRDYFMLIYGIAVIIIMVFMPLGIAGLFKSIAVRIARRKKTTAITERTGA